MRKINPYICHKNFADSTGLGISQQNGNISVEFSLKVSNHKVGDLLLKGRVGDSRL
jgi:hypothetical protein